MFLHQAGVQFLLCELIKALQGGELQMEWRCAVLAGSSLYFGALLTTIFLQSGVCIQFRADASRYFAKIPFFPLALQLLGILECPPSAY